MNTLDAALGYAARGWHVLPIWWVQAGRCACRASELGGCTSPGKHPLVVKDWGGLAASADAAQIRGWWSRWPRANVAIATGRVSGLVVLDVDVGPGKDGAKSLADAMADDAVGLMPLARKHSTGGGGAHVFFAYPPAHEQGCKVGILPGLDVRGYGGYVVAPPSMHVSGARYLVHATGSPAPWDWLGRLIGWAQGRRRQPPARTGAASQESISAALTRTTEGERVTLARAYMDRMPAAISGHGGHNQTFQVAQVLVRGFGLPEDVALELLTQYNQRCEPPWSPRELQHKITSAATQGTMVAGCKLVGFGGRGVQPIPPPPADGDAPAWVVRELGRSGGQSGAVSAPAELGADTAAEDLQACPVLVPGSPEWFHLEERGFDPLALATHDLVRSLPACGLGRLHRWWRRGFRAQDKTVEGMGPALVARVLGEHGNLIGLHATALRASQVRTTKGVENGLLAGLRAQRLWSGDHHTWCREVWVADGLMATAAASEWARRRDDVAVVGVPGGLGPRCVSWIRPGLRAVAIVPPDAQQSFVARMRDALGGRVWSRRGPPAMSLSSGAATPTS
jgi:hypothetical protein